MLHKKELFFFSIYSKYESKFVKNLRKPTTDTFCAQKSFDMCFEGEKI